MIGKYGDHAISTDFTIKMSLACNWYASSMRSNTHTRFFTRPGYTQQPSNRTEPLTAVSYCNNILTCTHFQYKNTYTKYGSKMHMMHMLHIDIDTGNGENIII